MIKGVRLVNVKPQAWRNGGGNTRELLTWPPDAGAADWLLRVSVAQIDVDGPFSAWPGMDRWFAVISGNGVEMALPAGSAAVTSHSAPLCFDGVNAPDCRLLDGSTQDLNLMVRRDKGRGAMRRAQGGSLPPADAVWRGLYTAEDVTLERHGELMTVAADSLVWQPDQAQPSWQLLDANRRAWWLTWSPA